MQLWYYDSLEIPMQIYNIQSRLDAWFIYLQLVVNVKGRVKYNLRTIYQIKISYVINRKWVDIQPQIVNLINL